MFKWLKRHFSQPKVGERGTVTRICRSCGRIFTLPENVQHWPDYCQECRAKNRAFETVTRRCRSCGKTFQFPTSLRPWPKYCRECGKKRRIWPRIRKKDN